MNLQTVLFECVGNVGIITINRPDEFNALNIELSDDITLAMEESRRSKQIRSIILTGTGKAFCSGGDLIKGKEVVNTDPPAYYKQLTKSLNRAILEIRQSEKPVIAAINGAVGGAGFSIAMACDLKIAAKTAKFKQAYTSLGLVPDGGFTVFVPRLVGWGKTNEFLFLDPVINAEEALAMGLVNMVVAPDELNEAALKWANQIAKGATTAYGMAKQLVNESIMPCLEKQIELERLGVEKAGYTKDYPEGLTAFLEKRDPVFIGE